YITEKTDWFGELKEFRDHYIVHPYYFYMRGIVRDKEDGKTKPVYFHKSKASMKLPDIEKMMDNILEFLNFLNGFFTFLLTGVIYRNLI
ncbi:MAG: hypothetical protein ACOC5T_09025, partial [Elusimicrobiota bacterium]